MTRRSMTAFGRAQKTFAGGQWSLDIHSVNRKGLDMSIFLPNHLLMLDADLRKWIQEIAERGQISIRVSFELTQVEESVKILKKMKQKWMTVAKSLGLSTSDIDLPFLLERMTPDLVPLEKKDLKEGLFQTFKAASSTWLAMKEKEGAVLGKDVKKRTEIIKKELKKIEALQPQLKQQYRKRLVDRMKELGLDIPEERLLREAALLAEKSDITEEITRLNSHLDQMDSYLSSKEKSVGRTLDFLSQELGREINTLMAKAGDAEISKLAILIKSEVEKIREQVQNIE